MSLYFNIERGQFNHFNLFYGDFARKMAVPLRELLPSALAELVELEGAIILADVPGARALASSMGLSALLERGVLNVLPLGALPPNADRLCVSSVGTPERAVVLCSSFNSTTCEAIRRTLCQPALAIRSCFVLCPDAVAAPPRPAAAEEAAAEATEGGYEEVSGGDAEVLTGFLREHLRTRTDRADNQLSAQVASAAGPPASISAAGVSDAASAVSVRVIRLGLPLELHPIGRSSFLLGAPAHSPRMLPTVGPPLAGTLTKTSTSPPLSPPLSELAADLLELCTALGLRPMTYALGPLSHALGMQIQREQLELSGGSTGAGSSALQNASLVMIDRSLDLVAPSSFSTHPLEAAAAWSGHGGGAPPTARVPEWLQPEHEALAEALLARRVQEVPQQLLKALTEAADEAGVDVPRLPPRPTASALRHFLSELQAGPLGATSCGATLAAAEQLLECAEPTSAAEGLVSHQKVLQHSAAEVPLSAFGQIQQLASRVSTAGAPADDLGVAQLLPMLCGLYSLLGGGALGGGALGGGDAEDGDAEDGAEPEHEQRLRQTLLQACLRRSLGSASGAGAPEAPAGSPAVAEIVQVQRALDEALGRLFETLRAVAATREGLGTLAPLLLPSRETAGEVYRPLLREVLSRVLNGEDVTELSRASEHKGGLLSRGAKLLGVKSAPRPSDNATILLFVVGGITVSELREARMLAVQHHERRILVGSTRLVTPVDISSALCEELFVPIQEAADRDEIQAHRALELQRIFNMSPLPNEAQ